MSTRIVESCAQVSTILFANNANRTQKASVFSGETRKNWHRRVEKT
jgi:hypothetical protein